VIPLPTAPSEAFRHVKFGVKFVIVVLDAGLTRIGAEGGVRSMKTDQTVPTFVYPTRSRDQTRHVHNPSESPLFTCQFVAPDAVFVLLPIAVKALEDISIL
jgi:hypothetical protein